jgi:Peptidase A4 family
LSPTPSPSPTPTPVPLPAAHCPATDTTASTEAGESGVGQSPNWVGSAIYPAQGSTVSCVEGSWIEPKPQCPKLGNSEAFIFIAIDGLGSPGALDKTIEQLGTHVQCFNGRATHFAYDAAFSGTKSVVPISGFTVSGGDRIWAMITVSGTKFTFTIKNLTHVRSFSTSTTFKAAQRSVAAWAVSQAVKAPCTTCFVDLAPFGTVTFTGAYTTVAGHRGSISDAAWLQSQFDMLGKTSLATVSSLSIGGTSFKVAWVHK